MSELASTIRIYRTSIILAGLAMILTVGCTNEVPTISFDEFLDIQRQLETPPPPPAPTNPETGKPRVDEALTAYRAGPDDIVRLYLNTTAEELVPEFTVRVHGDGMIMLPMAGKVNVDGNTLEEIEELVFNAYVPDYLADLSVLAMAEQPHTTGVIISGSVLNPGLVNLPRHQRNLLYAVLLAGGVTPDTTGMLQLRRIRTPGEEILVDLTDPVEVEAALALPPLENGDMIEVGTAPPNTIYVGGLVNAPAPQIYPAGAMITYLQAIAAAGGIRQDVYPEEGLLVRRMADGRDVRVALDLDRLADGKDENFTLLAGDILWVPETDATKFQDYINRNLFFRAGVSATYDPIQFENTQRALRQSNRQGNTFSNAINDSLRFGLQNAFFPTTGVTP